MTDKDAKDIIRVLRVIEYVGPRDKVMDTLERSIHGTVSFDSVVTISAAVVDMLPEALQHVTHTFPKTLQHATSSDRDPDPIDGL